MNPGDMITPGSQQPPDELPQPVADDTRNYQEQVPMAAPAQTVPQAADQAHHQPVMPGQTTPEVAPQVFAQPPAPTANPAPAPVPAPVSAPSHAHEQQVQPEPPYAQHDAPPEQPVDDDPHAISWTASEFVAHSKGTNWYAAVVGIGIAASVIIYFVTRDIISATVILFVAIAFAAFSARPPRVLQYRLTDDGIQIGSRFYLYNEFKSFSILDEDQVASIWLMPLKRFMPGLSMYYSPQDEEKIADRLSEHLPYEERDHDVVEKLMKKIRF